MKPNKRSIIALTLTAALLTAIGSNAAVVQTTQIHASSATNFDSTISTTDLINVGQATLESAAYSFSGTFGGTTGAHDGSATANANIYYQNSAAMKAVGSVTMTFTLNTVDNMLGYDITSIASIYGYGTSTWADQIYDVSYATVSSPTTYVALSSVSFTPAGTAASSILTLTDSNSGFLASGVKSVRFILYSNPAKNNDVGIVREFDVFGSATVIPEPSTVLLALLRRRR